MTEPAATSHDVFISYSRADQAWVWQWLIPRLKDAGLKVYTERDFVLGAPQVENISRAIDASRHVLLVLTPAWVESQWQNFTGLLARSDDPVGYRRRTIPLLLEPCQPLRSIARLVAADFTDAARQEDQFACLLEALLGHRHRTACGPPLGALQGLEAPMQFDFMRNTHFVGREHELAALHDLLYEARPLGVRSALAGPPAGSRLAGLTGLGGIGKTQLAVEYVYRFKDAYPGGVFWITVTPSGQERRDGDRAGADAYQAMADGFAAIGRTISGNGADKPRSELVSIAADYLRADPETLVVLDNLPDPGLLNRPVEDVLNPAELPCRVLFTTRRRDQGDYRAMDVGTLPPNQALFLLLRHESRRATLNSDHAEHEEAQHICATLGYLPLALELAGAHLGKRPQVPLARYREDLETRRPLLVLDDPRGSVRAADLPTRHVAAVEATFGSQWDTLENEDTRLLLRVAGQLPEAAIIPIARLGLLAGVSDEEDSFFGSRLTLSVQELHDASLVERLKEDQVRLHPLVREFAMARTPCTERDPFRRGCAKHLSIVLQNVANLEKQCAARGVGAVETDLLTALALTEPRFSFQERSAARLQLTSDLQAFLRLLQRESHSLRNWHPNEQPALFAQQIHKRAVELRNTALATSARQRLAAVNQPYLALRWRVGREASQLERTLRGHSQAVHAVAMTPDGRRAISASYDGTLKVWDLATGQEERTLVRKGQYSLAVAVTPDGHRTISASSDHTLKVWDLASGQEVFTLSGHSDAVHAVAVTPDGRRAISASDDGALKVWDMDIGQEERTLRGHCSTGRSERVRGPDSNNQYSKLPFEPRGGLAMTPDGRRAISTSAGAPPKVWDLASGQEVRTLSGHDYPVCAVAVTPDGRRVVSAGGLGLTIWNLESGQVERSFRVHDSMVVAVAALGPDGRRAISASWDGTLMVWDLETGQKERTLYGHGGDVYAVAATPDGRRAISASWDGTLKVWDLQSSQEERELSGHSKSVSSVAISPDRRRAISASWDQTLKVWDLQNGQEERTFRQRSFGNSNWVRAVVVTPNGQQAISASADGTLKVWDLQSGRVERTLYFGGVVAVAVTPDGRRVVSAGGLQLRVWSLGSGQEERTLSGHSSDVVAVAVTPGGQWAISASADGTLKVWDLESGHEARTFRGHSDGVSAVAAMPDDRRVISASREALKVWDLQSGQEERTLNGHSDWVTAVAVTSDGRRAMSASADGTLKVWDLDTSRELASIHLDSALLCVAVASDDVTAVAGDQAGNVYCLKYVEPGQEMQLAATKTEMGLLQRLASAFWRRR